MVPEETAYAYIGTEKPKAGDGEILSCAVGNTSYVDVIKNSYYVDKTLLIRDLIDDHGPGYFVYQTTEIWKNTCS